MYDVLVWAILAIGGLFLGLTAIIILSKAWRESRSHWRRVRRRILEAKVLSYAHGDDRSIRSYLGGGIASLDVPVLEEVLLDLVQRVRGIEQRRLHAALDEMGYVDRYLEGLRGRRWWRRAESAENLGLSGAQRATESLVEAMDDPIPEVRLRAAKALGVLGGAAAVRPLVRALDEPNRWSTIRIADILAGMGREVVEELIRSFPRMSLHGKIAVLDILARIHSLWTAGWLEARLDDPEPDVRARACHALGAVGDPATGGALVRALGDPEWPVRAMAAKALGRLRHEAAVESLCEAMRDRQWWVRANAAEALAAMGDRGREALLQMLEDPDRYARHQAVLMLEEIGVVDEAVGGLAAEGGSRRNAAETLVRRFVRVGQTGRLYELARNHPHPEVRAALAALLPGGGPEPQEATP